MFQTSCFRTKQFNFKVSHPNHICLLPFARARLFAAIRASRGTLSLAHTQTTPVPCHSREQDCLLPFARAGLFAAIRASRRTMSLVHCPNDWTLYRLTRSARRRTTCMSTTNGYVPYLQLLAAIRASRDCSLPFARALGLRHRYIAYNNWALSLSNHNISTYSAKHSHNL